MVYVCSSVNCEQIIEEMFHHLKSLLALSRARLKHEQRLARLLLGYQFDYFILSVIGYTVPRRWQQQLSSRDRLSTGWLALEAIPPRQAQISTNLAPPYLACPTF